MEEVTELTEQIVQEVSNQFAEAWNRGDIAGACEIYANDALYLTSKGLVRGKEAIVKAYHEAYPDPKTMGQLSLELLDFWTGGLSAPFAVAVFKWKIDQDGSVATGYVMEVYTISLGRAVIVHDASM